MCFCAPVLFDQVKSKVLPLAMWVYRWKHSQPMLAHIETVGAMNIATADMIGEAQEQGSKGCLHFFGGKVKYKYSGNRASPSMMAWRLIVASCLCKDGQDARA